VRAGIVVFILFLNWRGNLRVSLLFDFLDKEHSVAFRWQFA